MRGRYRNLLQERRAQVSRPPPKLVDNDPVVAADAPPEKEDLPVIDLSQRALNPNEELGKIRKERALEFMRSKSFPIKPGMLRHAFPDLFKSSEIVGQFLLGWSRKPGSPIEKVGYGYYKIKGSVSQAAETG